MTDFTTSRDERIAEFAEQFDFSEHAVRHLLNAVASGGGDMAMFDHSEFAGPGQWMRGGLIMITDPADYILKNRIEALCNALSDALRKDDVAEVSGHRRLTPTSRAWDVVSVAREHWWPSDLGEPSATGSQNDMAYAYFDDARQLAIRRGGEVAVYATGEHRITGTSQSQQNAGSHLSFTSQSGEVSIEQLERVDSAIKSGAGHAETGHSPSKGDGASHHDIVETIERLAGLRDKAILSEEEFAAKKAELLGRL